MSGIKLTWDIGAFNPEKHYIYRSASPISPSNLPTPIAEVGKGINQYNDLSIVDGETYHYFVAAEKMGLLCPADASVSVDAKLLDIFGDNSAVSLFKFDGNTNDEITDATGTWTGTEQYVAGIDGQAVKFDSSSTLDIVNHDYGSTFNYENMFSVSFWLVSGEFQFQFANSNNTNGIRVMSKALSDSQQRQFLVSAGANNTGSLYNYATGLMGTFSDGDHVVLNKTSPTTYDSYINGVLVSTITMSASGVDVAGNKFNTSGNTGTIDHFRIFNRTLTPEEVATLYNEVGGA